MFTSILQRVQRHRDRETQCVLYVDWTFVFYFFFFALFIFWSSRHVTIPPSIHAVDSSFQDRKWKANAMLFRIQRTLKLNIKQITNEYIVSFTSPWRREKETKHYTVRTRTTLLDSANTFHAIHSFFIHWTLIGIELTMMSATCLLGCILFLACDVIACVIYQNDVWVCVQTIIYLSLSWFN